MAKYCGMIGYATTVEEERGIKEEQIIEHKAYGDVLRDVANWSDTSTINGVLKIGNQLSIIVDAFAKENFHHIRYAEYMGTKWNVNSVETQYPRLILHLGGVYNGKQA